MNELISNILRGSVSSVMYMLLLFTLARTRLSRKGTIKIVLLVFLLNFGSTIWFYLYGDLTTLSRFSVVLYIVAGLALKPLTRLNFMQWSFTFLTTLNIGIMIIILSFYLGRLFPMPQYANTIIRLVLYIIVIYVFNRYLISIYRSIVKNWPVFSVLVICIFLNLSYYFYVTDDIISTLETFRWPLILLVMLSVASYGTVFYSLKKFLAITALETENLKIQKDANCDNLTGLPNRRYFFERLAEMVKESARNTSRVAVLYIDLDGFKDINDTYGHQVGDDVLITVGNRLTDSIRETDFAARLGGDEFAVVIHDIEDIPDAQQLANRIHAVLQEEMKLEAISYRVNASIGIAIYPDTGEDSETLLKNADSAMYEVKRNGKGGIGFCQG